jgi:succinate dehydrogenase / fumarate reductase cytochrome b subunit
VASEKRKRKPFLADLWSTAVGKKYAMALSGIAMMGFVFFHMVGNLKAYFGEEDLNHYAEFLRDLLYPIAPEAGCCGSCVWGSSPPWWSTSSPPCS